MKDPLDLHLEDVSWPKARMYKDRNIARAIIFDGNKYIFAHIDRDDEFASLSYIETSGGGVKKGETLEEALRRELEEELGLQVEIVAYLGQVIDYYNLIGRRNLNHYFLVRKTGELPKNLMEDEKMFNLHPVELTYEEAKAEYKRIESDKLGKLVARREEPVLEKGNAIVTSYGLM